MARKYLLLGLLFVLLSLSLSTIVSAQATQMVSLENPLSGGETTWGPLIGKIIKTALGFIGSIALLVFFYGGFQWLISAGNAEKVKSGTNAMLWAIIGLFIIFASYAILTLVFKTLTG